LQPAHISVAGSICEQGLLVSTWDVPSWVLLFQLLVLFVLMMVPSLLLPMPVLPWLLLIELSMVG
jgi:hypothetical protein